MATPRMKSRPFASTVAVSTIEDDRFPIGFISELAEVESWRKEIYRPIYHVHKWWAKRLGSVFRAIILGSVIPKEHDLEQEFYRYHSFDNVVVFDPFMGSGTTVGEAYKLGCISLGRDINPVACDAVRIALGKLDIEVMNDAFLKLSQTVGARIRQLYQTRDREGRACDTLYYFWVKTVRCPTCSAITDLFNSYVFARNAYPDRKPEVRIYCPSCSNVFLGHANDSKVRCDVCNHCFDPHIGPAIRASVTCQSCDRSFRILKAIQEEGGPPRHRLYAKLVLTSAEKKQYLPITKEDVAAYERCTEELSHLELQIPTLALTDGNNTRQAMNYGYRQWRDFFNERQLLALGLLRQAICLLEDKDARDAMLTVFSGTLEFNNMFTSYKGEGTGAVRHMFSHHILKPERMPIEGNVWGTPKSSGSFSTLFKSRILRAIDYREAPFEVGVQRNNGVRPKVFGASRAFTGQVDAAWPPLSPSPEVIHISCGSSDATGLTDESVDIVVTDPPFFDNVHYSELADFFYAWQQLNSSRVGNTSTRDYREVQDTDPTAFAAKLRAVFSECRRVLKRDRLLVFTYHHSRIEGWFSLIEAVLGAGFEFVNAHPIKAEMSVATPKAQAKDPIQLDVILVCRKLLNSKSEQVEIAKALERTLVRARQKAVKLTQSGLRLSLNDSLIILIGTFLVEACRARSSPQLIDALRDNLEALSLTAKEFLDLLQTCDSENGGAKRKKDAHQVHLFANRITS